MALEITGMTRSFTFKKGSGMITLDDPNPSDSPEMVMSYYSNFFMLPILWSRWWS